MQSLIARCFVIAAVIWLAACTQSTNGEKAAQDFVRVEGTHFYLGDKPYRYVGANMWYGAYLGSPGATGDRQRLIRELDILAAHGITNLRVLAASENSDLTRAVRPGLVQNSLGELNNDLLLGLDFLLAEMAKRDMKAVLYLTNYWQWSGGMLQYVEWFSDVEFRDPDITGDWKKYMQDAAKFYRITQAQNLYHNVIYSVVTRTNSITGQAYNNDPTIMAWQLANEPRPGNAIDGRANFEAFSSWIDTSAGYIKSIAPKQLVSTGSEGTAGTLGDQALFESSHASPHVDYLTFHMWFKNWGWFNVNKPEETYDSAVSKAKHYLSKHIEIAERMNKPLVLEEFGVERDLGAFDHGTPVVYRDRLYAMVFDVIENDSVIGGPFSGSNFWAWGGLGKTTRDDYMWQKGDDFFGDPPQEAQGLNSVFADDESTLKILNKHAQKLQAL